MDEDRKCAPVKPIKVCVVLLIITALIPVTEGQGPLYHYGPAAGDKDVGEIGTHETAIPLPIATKYYGQTFRTAYILKDGMVALEPGVRYLELEWRDGTPNHAIDRPFIAPFHYDGFLPLMNPQAYPGKIYYKLLSKSRQDLSLTEQDRQWMNDLDDYLNQASVVLKAGFRSQYVLKVTWENVTSIKDCTESQLSSPGGCPFNTFQVVIVANTEHTFAIFNYYKMDIPFTVHQLAGLNGGHGRGWTDVIPCTGVCAKRSKGGHRSMDTLVSRVGSDVAGRYILVIDDDIIVRGGCLQDGLKFVEMEVYPRQAGMFGGEMLSVSGVCNAPGTKIFCRFGHSKQAVSEGVMESSMRGRCPVPILTTRGEVFLEMSSDNMAWKTNTFITIIHPSRLPPPMDVSGIIQPWFQRNPQSLRVTWNKELFSSNLAATLDLNLIGYREETSGDGPVILKNLQQLATGLMNQDEEHTLNPAQFACSGSDCQDFEIGLVQLRVNDRFVDSTTKYQSVNLGPVSLGWYVNRAMTETHGENWPSTKCRAWNERDRQSTEWLEHLLPCPCTLSQALADWGRWQADMGCNMFARSVCTYHVDAKHCVRSVHPSPEAAGNQCCYEKDGNLRYAADTYQGSTPDRSHDWGTAPFGTRDHVPSLSHWLHDVITFYYCCLWVDYGDCNYYMKRRATQDCKAYVPPHAAAVFGDPHVTTFDGSRYHFGGEGDFWILQSSQLNIQGRFEQRENENLQINTQTHLAPTNLTSLVMWSSGSDVITINLAPPGGPVNRKLDIKVGSVRRFFEDSNLMWQDFKGVSIVNNAPSTRNSVDQQHSNFTVLFVGGAGVQVAERQGLFHLMVILPPNSGQTQGLLGTLDGNPSNDFRNPQGEIISSSAQADKIYLDFALKWSVAKDENKFHFPKVVDTTKTPLFGDAKNFDYKPESSRQKPSESEVRQVCGESVACRRDYYVSGDVSVARASRQTEESFDSLRHSQAIVPTCGLLDIPMSKKSSTVYTNGSVVTVTGCRPDDSPVQGSGPLEYTCTVTETSSNWEWSPSPDRGLCPFDEEEVVAEEASDIGMIVGIVVGVVIVIVIVVIIVVLVVCGRRQKRGDAAIEERADRPVPTKRTAMPADVIEPASEDALLKRKGKEGGGVKMSEVITEMKGRSRSEESV